ncbi:MAG: TetR/AcrR family transcriptional regulator [Rhodoluna sp.]|nr:TetR/AcrR family transcriptional regulator [Rhodoluna sp.]
MNNASDSKQATGRQDAYRARTRASLLKSAHQVLADIGLNATIEDLAKEAQVSPATIYNHFESKDEYLKEALNDIWLEWVTWAYDGRNQGEGIETKIDVCRRLFRVNKTHTLLGRILAKTLNDSPFVIDALRPNAMQSFKTAVRKDGLDPQDLDIRLELWAQAVAGIFQGVFVTKKFSPETADKALRISLAIWGIDAQHAEALTTKPLKAPSA